MKGNVSSRATKNSFGLIFSQLLSKVVALFAFVLLAKYLSVENFGLYNYAFAFWTIVASIIEGGLGVYATREIAREPKSANSYLISMIFIKSLFSAFVFFVVFLLGYFKIIFNNPLEFRIIVVFGVSVLLSQTMWYSIITASRGLQYFKIEMLTTFLNSLFNSLSIFITIYFYLDLMNFVVLMVLANFLLVILSVIYYNKINKLLFLIELPKIIKFFKNSIPLSLAYILGNTNARIGTLLLSYFVGDAALGIFSASSRFLFQAMFIISASMITIYPIISDYYEKDVKKITGISIKYIKLFLISAVPSIMFIFLFADNIIVLLFGDKYQGTEIVLKYVTVWFFIWGIKSYTVVVLQSIDKEKKIVIQSLLGLFSNILFCIILIPSQSFIGLSLAMVLSETIMLLYGFYFFVKYGIIQKLLPLLVVPVVFLFCFFVAYKYFHFSENIFTIVPIYFFTVVVFFTTIYLGNYFRFSEIYSLFKNNY